MILDFGFSDFGGVQGCTTRQFGDGAWRSEARIPPGLPLGATSKPTVSNRVGARKQIEHFFRGQNPTKSQKNPDFQPRGQNFTKSQKNPDCQPRGQNPTKSQKKPRLPTQRSELYKITEKPRLQSLSSYTVDSFILRNCNFIAMNFLAQINVDYPGRRPQAPACFKYPYFRKHPSFFHIFKSFHPLFAKIHDNVHRSQWSQSRFQVKGSQLFRPRHRPQFPWFLPRNRHSLGMQKPGLVLTNLP